MFIQASDIADSCLEICLSDVGYVSEADWIRYPLGKIERGELLIEVKGQAKKVVIVPDDFPPFSLVSGSLFKAEIDQSKVSTHFVFVYLLSRYGTILRDRLKTNTLIGFVSKQQLYSIPIVMPEKNKELSISDLVKKSFELIQSSKQLLRNAEKSLAEDIDLGSTLYNGSSIAQRKLQDILDFGRMDAEFFHPKFDSIQRRIYDYRNGYRKLGHISKRILPNYSSNPTDNLVDYIEIGCVDIDYGDYRPKTLATRDLPANAKIKLTGGEIVVSLVRPTRGAIAIVDDNLQRETICSTAFYVCRVDDTAKREIVWLYLRIISSLFEKYCSGTSYPTIEGKYVYDIPVPEFSTDLTSQMKHVIGDSTLMRRRSHAFIKEAISIMEQIIIEGASYED